MESCMDFSEVVVKRRSVRKFKEDAVSADVLKKVLDATRWAPSAGNCQPWRFIVVRDGSVKEKIAENCTRFSKKAWTDFSPKTAKYLAERGRTWNKSYMKRLPVMVVVCYEVLQEIREELVLGSVWAAIENMLLAATAESLGSCVYTFYDSEEEVELKKILRTPENYRVAGIVQLGYASAEPPTPSRKRLEEIISYEHF